MILASIISHNRLLHCRLVHKLAFGNMVPVVRAASDPHLILECPSLSLFVLELAEPIRAWPVLANCLEVGELAVRHRTVTTVPTDWRRVAEGAVRVLAVGIELAVLLALVGYFRRR